MKIKGAKSCCSIKNAVKNGYFKRQSDRQKVQRYRCKTCQHNFSKASLEPEYYQKKRHLNRTCMMLLASNVSMRRTAKILRVHPITVARKLEYLGAKLSAKIAKDSSLFKGIDAIQFDELQTIEHTKCKPVSVAMAVCKKNRKMGVLQK